LVVRVNVSAVQTYLECPRKWYYKYVRERGIDEDSEALRLGILWHKVAAGDMEVPLDAPEWMHRAKEDFDTWLADHSDVEVLAKETKLETQLGGHTIFGTPDCVLRWNGMLWHGQHKTISPQTPLDVYKRMVGRSYHEHIYKKMILETYAPCPMDVGIPAAPAPYGGTILMLAIKFTYGPRSKPHGSPFAVEYLGIRDNAEILGSLSRVIDQMEASPGWPPHLVNGLEQLPPQNPDACGGRNKNKLCVYVDTCDGRTPIERMPHFDPLARYSGDVASPADPA